LRPTRCGSGSSGTRCPARTAGGQRRYGEADVARVEWLKARLAEGYRIGEAALLLGGTDAAAAGTPEELRAALLAAVERDDGEALEHLLDQAFVLGPLETTLSEVVAPTLEAVGDAWVAGRVSVAQEHLLSAAVRARLERLVADPRGAVRGVAVLACAPGEHHELGLLMLAVLLRADGWRVAYLGANTPVVDAAALAHRLGASMLCLSAALPERAGELDRGLREAELNGVRVVVGGAGMTPEQAAVLPARYVEGALGAAVRALRTIAA
jgi:methanogenic corrinoid protein MtbC1